MAQSKKYFTIGSVLGETINLYANNFLKLWLPYILISVPFSLVIEFIKANYISGTLFTILSSLLSFFISYSIILFVTIRGIKLYSEKESVVSQVILEMKQILFPYILLQILIFLGILGGLLLLIVPGIIFSLFWAVASIAFIVEKSEIRTSMKRSRFLTKGFKGEILITSILIALIGFVLYFTFTLISSTTLEGMTGFIDRLAAMGENPLSLSNIIYSLISSTLSPLYPVFAIVMYFALIKEKEGFETEELAGNFMNDNGE